MITAPDMSIKMDPTVTDLFADCYYVINTVCEFNNVLRVN
jgi:hypothetical protein